MRECQTASRAQAWSAQFNEAGRHTINTRLSSEAFGEAALKGSPRVGHLHITVDDLPWLWADASDLNTIDIAGLPPGPHKVKIELVDANHNVFPGQVATVTFTVPAQDKTTHK